jgi:hypothetical protein
MLEFLLVSVLAAALLASALPIFASIKRLISEHMQLSKLQTSSELIYNLLSTQIRAAGGYDCQESPLSPALEVNDRSTVHDHSVDSSNNVLVVSTCAKYKSNQHWLETAYFIAKNTVSHEPALYRKVTAIDGDSVSLPKVELISNVKKIHFTGFGICAGAWCASESKNLKNIIVDLVLSGGKAMTRLALEDTNLPVTVGADGNFIFRASWALASEGA